MNDYFQGWLDGANNKPVKEGKGPYFQGFLVGQEQAQAAFKASKTLKETSIWDLSFEL